jgi:large subunit ribosomal protein L7/L12
MATKKTAAGSSVDSIIETIESMTVLELADLVEKLKDKFGVSAMPMMAAGPADANGAAAAEVEEQTEFDVNIAEVGPNKIPVIKVVRKATGLGLREAKAVVDEAPGPVKQGISKQEAEELAKLLEAEGAKVEIK